MLGLLLLFPFLAYIAVGYIACRLSASDVVAQQWLDRFVFYFALPALLFQSVRAAPAAGSQLAAFLCITAFATGSVYLAGLVLAPRFRGETPPAVFALASSYSNIGYMGPVLTVSLFGPAAGTPAALIFCADILVLFSLWACAGNRNQKGVEAFVAAVKRIVLHPFVLAVLAALILVGSGIGLPLALETTLDGVKQAAAPCALFSLGLTLARSAPYWPQKDLVWPLSLKLFLHPLTVAGLLAVSGDFEAVWTASAILMAALPPAANVYVMARAEGQGASFAANAVFWGTLASVFTLPLMLGVLIPA